MPFKLLYHPLVASDDLPRLDSPTRARLRRAIERRLSTQPQRFGKPLRLTLQGLWALRVGDWRVIYKIEGDEVWILKIGHRREVYERVGRRIRSSPG
jgi:mRNA interferase RelE/StbE